MENTKLNNQTYKKSISQLKSETMNIEKALNRLQWRFKNENVKVGESKITINELDVKAVEFLTDWINNQKKETLVENMLFAKMFVYAFNNELIYYNGGAQSSSRKLQEVLEMPIQVLYDKTHELLNMFELSNFSKSIGIPEKHPALRTDEESELQKEIIKKNSKEMTKYVLGIWDLKAVYKSLNNNITECINKYKNLP